MAEMDGFVFPDDASETLRMDIAAALTEKQATDGFVLPDDASESLKMDIAAQKFFPPEIARREGKSDENTENEPFAWIQNAIMSSRQADDFVVPDDASESLKTEIVTQMLAGYVIEESERKSDENTESEPLARIQKAIMSSNRNGDCQNGDLVTAIEQLVSRYKKEGPKTTAAQQVIRSIIINKVDNALASILYNQLTEGLRHYKTSKNFGGNLNNVIGSILEFFDVFTQKSLEISRHAADTYLVDAIKLVLTKFKVPHFQNKLNENIQRFLYLGLKLSCQLLMYGDDTVVLCIKDKWLIDILRLYISSPDPRFQLLALTATAYLSSVRNSDRFVINPLAMKTLMESVRDNNSEIPTETMALALEKLMQFENNVEELMELDFISSLKAMLKTDDVSIVLAGLRLLTCLSNDDSIAPLVRDQLIYVLRSRCLSSPNSEVKTATSRLIFSLKEKSSIDGTTFDRVDNSPTVEGNQSPHDIIRNGRHIMVSHSLEDRDKWKAIEIHDHLQEKKFETCIYHGSPRNYRYEDMASAVENSSMFVYCMSESYKESDIAKKEFLRAVELKKTMVAVRLEEVTLDGWLGLNVAGAFIHDLREMSDEALCALSDEISRLRAEAQGAQIDFL